MREKLKEEIVGEYLAGEESYREMELRHGVSSSTLHRWVKATGREAGREAKAAEGVEKLETAGSVSDVFAGEELGGEELGGEELASEVKRLRGELRKAELHNKLLNAMIDIAEEQFEIPIRKKHGARQ